MRANRIIVTLLATLLLLQKVGYGQSITVGVDGMIRNTQFSNFPTLIGPLSINRSDRRFTYGVTVSYQNEKNGIELGVSNYPYRIDLKYNNFFSEQSGPSNIALFSVLYKRELFNINRYNIAVSALAGVNIGQFQYSDLYEGIGTASVNGVTIYTGRINRISTYDKSTVLLPSLKIEIDKNVFSRFSISGHASYFFRNWFGYAKPLEEGSYSYTYYQKSGSGEISDFGSCTMIGVSLKYRISLSANNE